MTWRPRPRSTEVGDVLDRLEDALVRVELVDLLRQERSAHRPPTNDPPGSGLELTGEQPQQRGLPGAVDPDDADAVARAEPPGDVVEQRASAEHDGRVLDVVDALAETGGREAQDLDGVSWWRLVRDEGVGGVDAEARLATSARAVHGAARPAPCGAGSAGGPRRLPRPLPLGPREHVGRVAAVVRVHPTVRDLPGAGADRVEEPPVVGDGDERAAPCARCRRASRRPRRRGGWSARRGRGGRGRPRAAPPGRPVGARRPTGDRRATSAESPPAAPRRAPRMRASPAHTWSGTSPRTACRTVAVGRAVGLGEQPDPEPSGVGHATGVRRDKPARIETSVVLPSPLRPTTPIRSPSATPSDTPSSRTRVPYVFADRLEVDEVGTGHQTDVIARRRSERRGRERRRGTPTGRRRRQTARRPGRGRARRLERGRHRSGRSRRRSRRGRRTPPRRRASTAAWGAGDTAARLQVVGQGASERDGVTGPKRGHQGVGHLGSSRRSPRQPVMLGVDLGGRQSVSANANTQWKRPEPEPGSAACPCRGRSPCRRSRANGTSAPRLGGQSASSRARGGSPRGRRKRGGPPAASAEPPAMPPATGMAFRSSQVDVGVDSGRLGEGERSATARLSVQWDRLIGGSPDP